MDALAKFLSNPAIRVAVASELSRLALIAEQSGNRAERRGLWKLAIANFRVSAEQGRASTALTQGTDFDPRDRRHVKQAAAHVRDRQRAAKAGAR